MTSYDRPTTDPEASASPHRPAGVAAAAGAPLESGTGSTADGREVTEAALFEAFGGVRGMVETVLPGLLFVAIFTVNKDLHVSAIAALAVSLVLCAVRLVRKDTVKHAFSGVFGVAFGVVFAMMTGNAKDFYLPGMLYTLGLALAYIITTLAGVPLIGLILGPVFKENLSWRTRNPGRKKAYAKASWAWGLILLAKCMILFPLYWWADTTQLGWVLVALKIPPFLLALYLTWMFLVKAPAPIDVFAEMEAQEKAEEAERERQRGQSAAPDAAAADAPHEGPRHRR
ncbi:MULTISPECIES: DUF3159 domain-containing protein [Streptomyces]|uniref:Membrane protein n=1 Tax=Streptomyces noursei TaxID=1971 RepID=A0A059WEX4_STRNR|nr:hypothetical protein DC74_5950 [Streptomyces noursei]AKA03094.1 membrane protein [Streptomyces noursei ZPM]EXU86384.1 membrane protein [Streptomyces noursei PD-1]GCB94072.1 membrane protein [Streptomyces noursei]